MTTDNRPKSVAIIGGYGKMGAWFTRLLKAEGFRVTVVGRDKDKLAKAAVELGVAATDRLDKAAEMEDGELKQDLVNMIASFMYNSCKAWNNENLSNEVIAEHLTTLSKGQLKIDGSELVVSADTTVNVRRPMPQKTNNFGRNNNNNINKNKNNKNRGKNFRRF